MRKRTRNILIIVIICAAAALIAAAAVINSRVTQVSLSKKAVNALSQVTSLRSRDSIRFEGSADQSGISFDVTLQATDNSEVSVQPSAVYSERKVDLTLMGKSTTQDNYIYLDGDTGTMYASADGSVWYRQDADGMDYSVSTQTMESFFEAVSDESQPAELSEEMTDLDGEEAYEMTATVSGDLLAKMMTGILTSIEGENSNAYSSVDWDSLQADVRVLVYRDTRLPAQITVDCPELGSRIMRSSIGGEDSTSLTCKSFSVQIDLDRYNAVSVTVPAQIKDSASELPATTESASTAQTASTEIAQKEEP